MIHLYWRLPYPLKVAAASLRGYRLRRWRYGPETERWVEEALDRERWEAADWSRWREERLAFVLDRAARRVPAYRAFAGRPLADWPVLEKEALRRDPRAFVADDCDPRRMYRVQTSGTTGTPLRVWSSRETVRRWYALCEARLRRWHGFDRTVRWGILGGQLVAPAARRRPPFWVWNAGLRQLYLSAYHLSPATAGDYLDAMRKHGVEYLVGYPSALAALARSGAPRLRVVVSNAEPLSARQRALIGGAFGCAVRDTYGMAEAVLGASECERGSLHLWPEAGLAETDGDGRLLCTSLLNADMPLIRYAVGDRATLAPASDACACGRGLPLLGAIEGRLDDVVRTPDGRSVGRLDPVFKADLKIREAQIVQEELDRIRVRVVAAPGYGVRQQERIRAGLRHRVGDMQVILEEVESIPRGPNGKFRAVVSLLPDVAEESGAGARAP